MDFFTEAAPNLLPSTASEFAPCPSQDVDGKIVADLVRVLSPDFRHLAAEAAKKEQEK